MSHKNKKNLLGQRFGRLIVIAENGKKGLSIAWLCKCDCGNEKTISSKHLKGNSIKSCGCLRRERFLTHGLRKTPEYTAWSGMKTRCYNSKTKKYKDYGGRGIKVCERWLNSFENFLADMGEKPKPKRKYSLDRIDNEGNYGPDNCRWATATQQVNNRRV